jgi:hypothetical protein
MVNIKLPETNFLLKVSNLIITRLIAYRPHNAVMAFASPLIVDVGHRDLQLLRI